MIKDPDLMLTFFWVDGGQGHVEGYHELSAKTKLYFATVVTMWDASFYIKVDDDVHVNLGKAIELDEIYIF